VLPSQSPFFPTLLRRWPIILPRIDVEAVEILDDEQRRVFQVFAITEVAAGREVRRLRLYSKARALDPAAAKRRRAGPARHDERGRPLARNSRRRGIATVVCSNRRPKRARC